MSKLASAVFVAALSITSASGQAWAQAQQSTSPSPGPTNPVQTTAARNEAQLAKTIVFINSEAKWPDKNGLPGEQVKLRATGFFVSVPDSRLGKAASFSYLVTNRHVAMAIERDENGTCTSLQIESMSLALNLKASSNGNRLAVAPIDLSQVHWYFPQDPAIDLAVTPMAPADVVDAMGIPSDLFLTSEILDKQRVAPGDRVLTAGFFSAFTGLHEIQPIFREGILAMLPDGPMTTTLCEPGNVYLADIHVIPGNSGSPIFIIPALGMDAGVGLGGVPSTFGLLGVVSGYMYENEDLTLTATSTWTGYVSANSGIAVVVPAEQLMDLLQGPELQKQRDEQVEQYLSTHPDAKPQPTQ